MSSRWSQARLTGVIEGLSMEEQEDREMGAGLPCWRPVPKKTSPHLRCGDGVGAGVGRSGAVGMRCREMPEAEDPVWSQGGSGGAGGTQGGEVGVRLGPGPTCVGDKPGSWSAGVMLSVGSWPFQPLTTGE